MLGKALIVDGTGRILTSVIHIILCPTALGGWYLVKCPYLVVCRGQFDLPTSGEESRPWRMCAGCSLKDSKGQLCPFPFTDIYSFSGV